MSDKTHAEPTTIKVSRAIKKSSPADEAESGGPSSEDDAMGVEDTIIDVHRFPDGVAPAYAEVEVPLQITRNFNSGGITVRVRMPCYAEELPDAIEEAYKMASDFVVKELKVIEEAVCELSD